MTTPTFNANGRLSRLRNRRQGPLTYFNTTQAKEMFDRILEDDAAKYLVGSMQPIDPEYTRNTLAEAERVKSQLQTNYPAKGVSASFEYQGSVTNNTHILRYSDVDLLTLTANFVFSERNLSEGERYGGNPTVELLVQHNASVAIIKEKFPEVVADTSGGKAIQLSGGSLRRKVDVITAAWWNTNSFEQSNATKDRGIKIFDFKNHSYIENKPFLHNFLINFKDTVSNGNLRKVIRMLKTIKADANEDAGYNKVDLSSYDICAVAYSMGYERLGAKDDEELKLAVATQRYLDFLEQNDAHRNSLDVPNGMRRIFSSEGASLDGLKALNRELKSVLDEIGRGLQRSFRTLDARLNRY